MTEKTNTSAVYQATSPHPDLKSLEKLAGTWNVAGEAKGKVTYEWMEGGFFLLQHQETGTSSHDIVFSFMAERKRSHSHS